MVISSAKRSRRAPFLRVLVSEGRLNTCHSNAPKPCSFRFAFSCSFALFAAKVLMPVHAPQYVKRAPQKLRNRNSLVLARNFLRAAGSGIMRAISTAPTMVEKITSNARSLSTARLPGMNRNIRSL